MNGSLFDRPKFQFRALFLQLGLAILLFASWAYSDSARAVWDQIDQAVFFALNGSLDGNPAWQRLWAHGNSHACDFVSAAILGSLLLHFMLADGAKHLTERAAIGIFIGLSLVVTGAAGGMMLDEPRASASLVLKPVHYLSELVTDVKTKDRSGNSFPGDHATVLWMVTLCFWYFGGRRYGLAALGVALLFVLPRLFAGAHWFTDVTAGALALSLASAAILLYTPLHRMVITPLIRILNLPIFQKLLKLLPLGAATLCRLAKRGDAA